MTSPTDATKEVIDLNKFIFPPKLITNNICITTANKDKQIFK